MGFTPRYMSFDIIDDFLNPTVTLPSLYIDINPTTLSQTFKKKTNRYQTFNAFVEEFWGEELDVISCNGTTGGFYLFEGDVGITTTHRNKTEAYSKFTSLLSLFRNNGNIYDENGAIIKKGTIMLNFDVYRYIGFFDTFNYSEVAENPFKFSFDFNFNVENSILKI